MNQYSHLKNALIAFFLLLAVFYALPNIFGSDLAVQISSAGDKAVNQADIDKITRILQEENAEYKSLALVNQRALVRFNNTTTQLLAKDLLKQKLGRNYVVALNLAPAIPAWLSGFGGKAMSLGLDLRGGVHFLLEVDTHSVLSAAMDKHYNELRSVLRKQRLYKSITKQGNNTLAVRFKNSALKAQALSKIKSDLSDLEVLPTQEALLITVQMSAAAQKQAKDHALKQNITTLRNRVNELGVAEPIIQQQGRERIVVQLPGVQDTARAKEILGAVATLEFRMVDEKNDPQTAIQSGRMPAGSKIYTFKDGRPLLLKSRVVATGENITGAASGIDSENATPMVNITLDSVGGRAMLAATKKYLHHRMAVVFIENKVETIRKNGKTIKKRSTTQDIINAATIQGTFSSRFQITGIDSAREARNLALLLRAGSLSAPIEIIEERTIGPSLGADNIKKGVLSVVVGLALVLVFMAIRYGVLGMVANLVLTLNLVMIVAVLSLLQATLTLPGIAGIVLTVGMAVDANVLIFERIKEELAASGNSIQKAIDSGYNKAVLTIADANITTLIAALVLFGFGTGPIKGFAITLSIGIVTSMFTAIIVSRAIINKLYGGKKTKALSL